MAVGSTALWRSVLWWMTSGLLIALSFLTKVQVLVYMAIYGVMIGFAMLSREHAPWVVRPVKRRGDAGDCGGGLCGGVRDPGGGVLGGEGPGSPARRQSAITG